MFMVKKIDHIGIAVRDLKSATKKFEIIFNSSASKEEFVKSQNVNTVFFKLGETKIELFHTLKIHKHLFLQDQYQYYILFYCQN